MGPSTPAERRHLAWRCRTCCLRRVPSVSASATLPLSGLNPPPHPITVYASHPPLPTITQHSLPGGALPPYRGRSFTGRIASASPDAPEPKVRIHSPPAVSHREPDELGANSPAQNQPTGKRWALSSALGSEPARLGTRLDRSVGEDE